ncbi:MAG TPA: WGR domain-containing protein [Lacunisphaera sp.]|nr:WGR domain-containing protein [Lacunisphaera sp.]
MNAFQAFLQRGDAGGGFGTDDILAAVLPLFEEVNEAHQRGQVVTLNGGSALVVDGTRLRLPPGCFMAPRRNTSHVDQLQHLSSSAVEVIGDRRVVGDLNEGRLTNEDLQVGAAGETPTRPVFLPGYLAWEQACDHHDQLTDIHSLGLLLASLACTLDLSDLDDLRLFAAQRTNLFDLNDRLHPVIAGVIGQMTELNRHKRVQTLDVVIQRLRHYRDQLTDYAVDFTQLKGFRAAAPRDRPRIILTHLRNRLFEISRRNRLIHFRATQQMLNLTLASVPLTLDYRNIQAEQLFIWHDQLARALTAGDAINLGQHVRFEDAPYASGILDQIIATERRDRNEFGFAQLRLVICFLHWHNLKDFPAERIHSPLLLLPVELVRKKGVRDAYVLKALSSEAEVNPALRHYLNQVYGLNLPAAVDLAETNLDAFHQLLARQIQASEPGVTLRKLDRPQIEFIHEKARQRLDQFRRKQRLSGRAAPVSVDYSYSRENFRPLGLQLFLQRVKPAPLPFAQAAGRAPTAPRPHLIDPRPGEAGGTETAGAAHGSREVEKHLFSVRDNDQDSNPYQWDFDLCTQTIGNFNYRKMSLVRDYAALLEQGNAGPGFDAIFSTQPKAGDAPPAEAEPLAAQFPVVDCDPTQALAVSRARRGGSYIIQGPPGTGKSQTITNLIADFVARGKRVLFVCEKRAAIDVVFHRLGRQGLDELCCLIHDSQTDKRDFIRNLKATYEKFLQQPVDATLETRRADLLRLMEIELAALDAWNRVLSQPQPAGSFTVRELLNRLIELKGDAVDLDALAREQVPGYELWAPHAGLVRSLSAALVRIRRAPSLAQHPFRHLSAQALQSPQPLAAVTAACDAAAPLLQRMLAASASFADGATTRTLGELAEQVAFAGQIVELAGADALELLNPRSARAKALAKAFRDWRQAATALERARAATKAWTTKLSETDATTALGQAKGFDDSLFRWLSPGFWRLRQLLHASYDFSSHALPPRWVDILTQLAVEHAEVANHAKADAALTEALGGIDRDLAAGWIETHAARTAALTPAARALFTYLVENPEATVLVENLAAMAPDLQRLHERLALVHTEAAGLELAAIVRELQALRHDLAWLPDLVPLLAEVLRLPGPLQQALRKLPLSDRQLERAMADQSYTGVVRREQTFAVTDGGVLAGRIARLNAHHRELLKVNALCLHQKVRREFLRKVQLSSLPASQLNGAAEKEFKKRYAAGRRELEHEFAKTMRHRSIRDLADDETGEVLRDLKPVWLMSPLSVSDTLPLAPDTFDVVIFDEASQILMEEALPAVARAPQIIVVGDEMQLPPTNFFSAARGAEDETEELDPAGPLIEDLDAESFLTQSARNLPSTMLGWHYRSRSESLISYSNHAFYEGRLLTVPDRRRAGRSRTEIQADAAAADATGVPELLARGVSFHYLGSGVYENRRNAVEAAYIAGLLRGLLAREDRPSIGIVAFSEAQQGEIESAINRLGESDADFRNRVEAEYEREDEGQFNGLFVKNLENVQGDERDIIILSICYGYDRNRRMLMNFGPINQRGGEKRLNVIFSRARKHMAVVSSIRHPDITNDYNDGAACLRNFLEYAAATSVGDGATASRVLHAANLVASAPAPTADAHDLVTKELAAALRGRGWEVEHDVGQSSFRLPLAVHAKEGETHALGVLIDDPAHYAQGNLLERYLQRPAVLRAFGWKLATVYAKDWFHDPDTVLRRLEGLLAGDPEPELAPVELALPPAPDLTAPLEAQPVPSPEPEPAPAPVPAPKAVVPPAVPAVPGVLRRFVCVEDGARKFWETQVQGTELIVRFGRIGTKGQTQTRAFASADGAQREADKLIRSKLGKGYTEEPPETGA